MTKNFSTNQVNDLVPIVVTRMRHETFHEICDDLGFKYTAMQQALRRRGLLISVIKHNYKMGRSNDFSKWYLETKLCQFGL